LKYENTLSNIKKVTARSGRVIVIAIEGGERIGELVEHAIHIPRPPSYCSPSSK
jgi:glucosamine--fructose-6-phosphate aminotransferase (isomerizing)